MKKLLFYIFLMLFDIAIIFGQASFSGTADMAIDANISESQNYDSLINKDNSLKIQDIGFRSAFVAKLDAGDEKTTFSAWFSLKEYPIGLGLMAGTLDSFMDGNNLTNDFAYTGDFIATAGDTIFTFDLMRLSANVYLSDIVSMEVGRQSMLTGYGYGWNPIDFANPLKNPLDPNSELRGVDGMSFRFFFDNMITLKIYGLLPENILVTGLEYEEIKAGGEITFSFSGIEAKLAGIYDYDKTEGSDAYVPSIGAAIKADLFGIGLYGEGALRKGSRNNFTDGMKISGRKNQWLVSALAGLEYTFSNELYAVFEYFYNGEGFNNEEREDFKKTIETFNLAGGISSDIFSIYSAGYFAKHYAMLNLMQPFYDINTDINLTALFSIDAGSFLIMPSVNYLFTGNFSGKLSYSGMFDFYNGDFSEVTAQPVKHRVSLVFTYSY